MRPSSRPHFGAAGGGLTKRSIQLGRKRTSVALEQPFWDCLKEIAAMRGLSARKIVTEIEATRGNFNLSSAIRVFVLEHYRIQAEGGAQPLEDQAAADEAAGETA